MVPAKGPIGDSRKQRVYRRRDLGLVAIQEDLELRCGDLVVIATYRVHVLAYDFEQRIFVRQLRGDVFRTRERERPLLPVRPVEV